jgi:membrane carboxypeptidase/penicillin-binding protein
MSKDEILEGYLNLVFFGNGAYGIQAAAERYFSRPASALTCRRRRCSPDRQEPLGARPDQPPGGLARARNVVLDRCSSSLT